jgi:hypothetical protein
MKESGHSNEIEQSGKDGRIPGIQFWCCALLIPLPTANELRIGH